MVGMPAVRQRPRGVSTIEDKDFEKFFVRVNVTEEFPFLVTKMSPYYDR
jgi:hypothetical protein